MKKLITLLIFFNVLGAGPALAVVVKELYMAEVLTVSQSKSELKKGAEQGLLQVLVRTSGNPDVGRNTVIKQGLTRASSYYYQYSFSSTDEKLTVGNETVAARLLTLHFDANAVAELLRDAGLPVWGKNRPAILLWIAIDEGDGRRLLSTEEDGELGARLTVEAKRRGLPLIFPVMDLEDAANISVQQVWGGFLDNIEKASKRYQPDSILTARLSRRRDGKWSGNWSYRPKDRWLGLARKNRKADELAAEMIDRIADELASLYALGSSETIVWLKVDSVNSVRDYARLSQYMESLAPVLDASVVEVLGENTLYRLRITGLREQLTEIIELDRKMDLLELADGLSRDGAIYYRWMN